MRPAVRLGRSYTAVYPFRLGSKEHTVGALHLFLADRLCSPTPIGPLPALADAAAITLLQHWRLSRAVLLAEQLKGALSSRICVERATGVLAEYAGIGMGAAFDGLRPNARSDRLKLSLVAEKVDPRARSRRGGGNPSAWESLVDRAQSQKGCHWDRRAPILVHDQTDAGGAVAAESSRTPRAGGRSWHVAALVENVPFGADHRLRKQVEAMLAAGFEVTVVTMRHTANDVHRGTPGLTLLEHPPPPEPKGPLGYVVEYGWSFVCEVAMLSRLRLRRKIDVLQVCQPPDIYFPLARVLRWSGTRVVVDQRDLMPELLAARYAGAPSMFLRVLLRVLRLFERWTQRVADRTVTVNEVLRERLVSSGARPEDVTVVWNGPVLSRVDAARPDPALREPGQRLVVWVGKMGVQDGVDLLPTLVDTVIRRLGRDDVRFAFLGDGELLDSLASRVAELELEPWVTLTGWVPEEKVFRYLRSADAGVDVCEQAEVTPVKALEYMAFGLPFACFDIAETRRLAVDAARFVPAGDVEALAGALLDVLDGSAGRRLGDKGRRTVRDSLAWERQVPTYLAAVGPGPEDAAEATPASAGH